MIFGVFILFIQLFLLDEEPLVLRLAVTGAFRERLKKTLLQRFSMGLDGNIPVSVNVAPGMVLQTAECFWQAYKGSIV
ncbi:hypothetical protein [Alishewanella longhuensis]